MPTIQIYNPLGSAMESVSSLAGGYAQGAAQQQRLAMMQQELELRKQREKAAMQAMEEERSQREEERAILAQERQRADELRSAFAEGFRGMNAQLPSEATPPMLQDPNRIGGADQEEFGARMRHANELAAKIAEKGGNPSAFLAAYRDNMQERLLEGTRQRFKQDLSRDLELGNLMASGPTGEPLAPDQNPYQAEIDQIALELDQPGVDPRPLMQRYSALKGKIIETRQAQVGKQAGLTILQGVLAQNPANQAAISAQAKVESGAWDLDDVNKNLGYIAQGLEEYVMPDGKSMYLPAGKTGQAIHQQLSQLQLRARFAEEQLMRLAQESKRADIGESQARANYYNERPTEPAVPQARPMSYPQLREMAIQNAQRKAGETLEGKPAITEEMIQTELRLLQQQQDQGQPASPAQPVSPNELSIEPDQTSGIDISKLGTGELRILRQYKEGKITRDQAKQMIEQLKGK